MSWNANRRAKEGWLLQLRRTREIHGDVQVLFAQERFALRSRWCRDHARFVLGQYIMVANPDCWHDTAVLLHRSWKHQIMDLGSTRHGMVLIVRDEHGTQ